jgi:acylaminoacyl-peptidase
MIRHTILTLLALAPVVPGLAAGQTIRTMTPLDLVSMDRVANPQVSPDGRQVAFVVSALDLEADRRRTDI